MEPTTNATSCSSVLHLGALPLGRTYDSRTAKARHAGPDGLGDALAVVGYGGGIEAVPPITHEEHHHVGLDLGVEGDLGGAGPLGGVDGGFPGRIEQSA